MSQVNIAFGKVGKSMKFSPSKYSPIGGDNEAACVLQAIANNNPDKTFYIVGRSDYSRLEARQQTELFPYGNVIDIWEGVKAAPLHHIGAYFTSKKIKIDFAVLMWGQVGTVTIPNRIEQVKNRHLTASVIDMTLNYSSPITSWMNDYRVPYVEIINDPRYKSDQARDIMHRPTKSLGQFDFDYTHDHIQTYDHQDLVSTTTTSVYAAMETSFLVGRGQPSEIDPASRKGSIIVLNEGKPSRYKELSKWVLDKNKDIEVYGQWDEEIITKDSRFKGSLKLEELQSKLKNYRSTFIIPIAKGWVTSKYIEMIYAGVVPILHPTYDEQRHLKGLLRPPTVEDMAIAAKVINEVDDVYLETITKLRDRYLKPDLFDGTYINQKIMESMIPDYKKPEGDFKKTEVFDLSSFF